MKSKAKKIWQCWVVLATQKISHIAQDWQQECPLNSLYCTPSQSGRYFTFLKIIVSYSLSSIPDAEREKQSLGI